MTAALAAAAISASAFMPTVPVNAAEGAAAKAVCPPAAQNKADHERLVLEKEHTDAVSMCLDGQKNMRLFTKADLTSGNGQRLAPEDVAFHVTDALKTQVPPKGFEFTGAAGKDAWMIPEVQNHDGIWAGWNTEEIREGMVDGNHVTMRLNQKKSVLPEGAQVELFQDGLSGTKRVLSSSDPKHSSFNQPLGAHVHANWTFTKPGVYRLVFSAEATVGGKKTADEKEYVFAVGQSGIDELKKPADDSGDQPNPDNPGGTQPPSGPRGGTSGSGEGQAPTQPNPPTDSGTPELTPDTVKVTKDKDSYKLGDQPKLTAKVKAKTDVQVQWQTKQRGASWRSYQGAAGNTLVLPKLTDDYRDMQARALAVAKNGAQTVSEPVTIDIEGKEQNKQAGKKDAESNGAPSAGGAAAAPAAPGAQPAAQPAGSAPQPCVPDSSAGGGAGGDAAGSAGASGGSSAGGTNGAGAQGSTAPKGQRVRAEAGHFDFGARLSGGQASAQIKDDRTAPPVWRSPDDVEFIIGQAAKKPVPAGYEFLGSAGSQVYMISQQQEDRVPWLGWNTQDPEIMNRASKVTMTLTNVSGPGQMHVFLGGSGLGGGNATRVFSKAGDSYQVPVGTHQHGFWAFTKPGNYTATIRFTVALKSGGTTTADGTLHFNVGGGAQAGGSIKADQQSAEGQQQDGEQPTEGATPQTGEQTADDSASPVPQPAGDPCALPRTGVNGLGATGAVGLGLLTVGAAVVWIQRRRTAK